MRGPTGNIGDRFQCADGSTLIAIEVQDGRIAMVLEDFEILEKPETFEWDPATWSWANQHWGPITPIEPSAEMTEAVTRRRAREERVAAVLATVPPAKVRDLYNDIAAAHMYTGKLLDAQAQVDRVSAERAKYYARIVETVGTQTAAAQLLGINQSTLSRALRPR